MQRLLANVKQMAVLRSRRGVALVLTLGILSLLLILALAFAAAALNAQRTAQSSTELTRARQYAELGLQRVIEMMKTELLDTSNARNAFPGTKIFVQGSGNWADQYFMLSMVNTAAGDSQMTDGLQAQLQVTQDGLTYFPTGVPQGQTAGGGTFSLGSAYSWLPIYGTRTVGNTSSTVLIGRFAYMILDKSGTIDPNAVVDDTNVEGSEIASSYNTGLYLSEISLTDLGFSATDANKMRPNGKGTGIMPLNSKWFDYTQIMRALYTDSPVVATAQPVLDMMNELTFPYRRPDQLTSLTTADFQKVPDFFDLTTLPSTSYANDSAGLANKVVLYNSSSSPKSPGIPWFKQFPDDGRFATAGDRFNCPFDRGMQLAANLANYVATSDDANRDAEGNTKNTQPRYWGNTKTPYISRLEVTLRNVTTNVGSAVKPTIKVYFRPELVNMFGNLSSYATNCWLDITYDITFTNGKSTGATTTTLLNQNNVWNYRNASGVSTSVFDPTNVNAKITGNFSSSGYIQAQNLDVSNIDMGADSVVHAGTNFTAATSTPTTAEKSLTNCNIRVTYIRLRKSSGGDRWDFAMPWDSRPTTMSWPATNTLNTLSTPGSSTDEICWLYTAKNPANNLWPPDWTVTGPVDNALDPMTATAPPTAPWNDPVKKIFIRSGPLQHLAELGAIYRMDPASASDSNAIFHTLNMIDYKYQGDPTIPGNIYADTNGYGGDRNILDMVKLGTTDEAARQMVGRVNINSRHKEVLRALFKRVPAATYTTGDAITINSTGSDSIDTLVAHIMARTNPATGTGMGPAALSQYPSNRNPPLYGVLFHDDVSGAGNSLASFTKPQLEHLLCQTQELVTAAHNYFVCLVVAQSIQDVGSLASDTDPQNITVNGVTIPSRLGRYDPNADKILAEQKILVVLYRNTVTNAITVERFDYLDN